MSAADRLIQRLQEIGLSDQQVIEAITAIQEYIKDRDNAIEGRTEDDARRK